MSDNVNPENTKPIEFGPFIQREEGKTYNCDICLDYGGVIDINGHTYPDGEPVTQVCECQLFSDDDD